MKKYPHTLRILIYILWITAFSCVPEDDSLSEREGTVRFGGIRLEFEPMGSPGSRVIENSPWVHIFPNSAELVFTNKTTGKDYILNYDPNDFSLPYSITLPYGAYEYHSILAGGTFSAFLPFKIHGEFFLDKQSLEIKLKAETDYGLVTVKNQYVEKASVSEGEKESELVLHQGSNYWFLYVKGGTNATLKIRESSQGTTIVRELKIKANRHYNFVLKLIEGAVAVTDLILASFELEEEEVLIGSGSIFFEENGTIKCPEAIPGVRGRVNDKVYEAVDKALLIKRRDEGADLSCVCTTLVTDMSEIFYEAYTFNQPIGNWDVSNVTDMSSMFQYSNFNQPIGNWNVSNVTNMNGMFAFNLSFNQALGDWDVSKVTDMAGMFLGDLRNLHSFNQSIENWDVSNVRNMRAMFTNSTFNQPIGAWDVSMVEQMDYMFYHALRFNQDLSSWCVQNISKEPGSFSGLSPLSAANKPVWGTCPD